MLRQINNERILFLDIETVPLFSTYDELPETLMKLWDKKAERIKRNEEDTPDQLYDRAGIYAEFGKIVCISVGFIKEDEIRIKSFSGDDEKVVLKEFSGLLTKHYNSSDYFLCAHNGKEFDFPYLIRRMLIQGIEIPAMLDLSGKKPWEVQHLDTMELWKFGDYKHYTSLELLAQIFGIPTPKGDIDGSDVGRVYWEDKDLERIVQYCQRDVLTIIQLFLRYQGKPMIVEEKVVIV